MQDGYTALPCKATVLREDEDGALLSMILREGKKREIRHRMETRNHPVTVLRRIRIGNILLGKRKPGDVKEIPLDEVKRRKEECLTRRQNNPYQGERNDDDQQ